MDLVNVEVGQVVKVRARARDRETKELVYPAVSCTVTPPGGRPLVLEVSADGEWTLASFVVDVPGTWVVTWSGEGTHEARGQMSVFVGAPR